MKLSAHVQTDSLSPSGSASRWHTRMGRGAPAVLLGLAVLGLAAEAVLTYNTDDNHFASAAYLVSTGRTPYLDFPFFQMPYTPYILALGLVGNLSVYQYLSLRLVNLAFCLAAVALVHFGCREISRSTRVGIGGALLFASSEHLHLAAAQLNGYAIANFFALLSFLLLVLAKRRIGWRAFLSGICLGAAIGSKLYYLVLAPPLLVFGLTAGTSFSVRAALRLGGSWCLGLCLALVPAGLLALDDPSVFWFDNYGYHVLNTRWRQLTESGQGMTLPGKVDFLTQMLRTPAFLASGVLGYVLYSFSHVTYFSYSTETSRSRARVFALALSLFIAALVAAMIPKPLWPSYFLAALPFAIFALASLFTMCQDTPSAIDRRWDIHIVGVAVVVSLLSAPSNLYMLKRATSIANWSTVSIHEQARYLRRLLTKDGQVGSLISFENLFAIEAGMPFPGDMAGHSFGYRVGDMMPGGLRHSCRIVSPATIGAFLDADPPAGILIGGGEDEFDNDLLRYAMKRSYREVTARMPQHRLFVPAEQHGAADR